MPLAFEKKYKDVKIVFIQRFPYGIHYTIKEESIIVIGISILHVPREIGLSINKLIKHLTTTVNF